MNDSEDGKPPGSLEPGVLRLWKKVFPRLSHYFNYPEPPYTRDLDTSESGDRQAGPAKLPVKRGDKPDGKG